MLLADKASPRLCLEEGGTLKSWVSVGAQGPDLGNTDNIFACGPCHLLD